MQDNEIVVSSICRNEEVLIYSWLEHLATIPQIGRIILIDNDSDDLTPNLIESFKHLYQHQDIEVELVERKWDFDFASARKEALRYAKNSGYDWIINLDIDEFFNHNAPQFFDQLDTEVYQAISFPHVKYWDLDQIYFRKFPHKTYYCGGRLCYSVDKSTMTLYNKDAIVDYNKPLHEFPQYNKEVKWNWKSLLGQQIIDVHSLKDDFFCIHADRLSLNLKARYYKTSLEFQEGQKRANYRYIHPTYTNDNFYDFSGWEFKPFWEYNNQEAQKLENLGHDQLEQAIKVEHDFPKINIKPREFLPESLRNIAT